MGRLYMVCLWKEHVGAGEIFLPEGEIFSRRNLIIFFISSKDFNYADFNFTFREIKEIEESKPKVLFDEMPRIMLKPCKKEELPTIQSYDCPGMYLNV